MQCLTRHSCPSLMYVILTVLNQHTPPHTILTYTNIFFISDISLTWTVSSCEINYCSQDCNSNVRRCRKHGSGEVLSASQKCKTRGAQCLAVSLPTVAYTSNSRRSALLEELAASVPRSHGMCTCAVAADISAEARSVSDTGRGIAWAGCRCGKALASRITHHASRITHHASRGRSRLRQASAQPT
jgi:hypothetical protein